MPVGNVMYKATPKGGEGTGSLPLSALIPLTQANILDKELVLPFIIKPGLATKLIFVLLGCGLLHIDEDYYIDEPNSTVYWNGYGLEVCPLQIGDRLQVFYTL